VLTLPTERDKSNKRINKEGVALARTIAKMSSGDA
jgi:hypothetical protein